MTPTPQSSGRIYLRLQPRDIALLRFHLESWDNLGLVSAVDKHAAVVRLLYSPGQSAEMELFLQAVAEEIDFVRLSLPLSAA
jgi:hypothetical protein